MSSAPRLLLLLGLSAACQPASEPASPPRAPAPAPATPTPTPKTAEATAPEAKNYSVDLLAKADDFRRNRPDATDGEFHVYRSDHATVHMHLIGVGQMCPLHIHRTTHEATIIVSGEPEVVHVYGEDGALTRREHRVPPGQLVYSPPFTGHQWTNVEPTPQANLVIASPKFDGNLYLHANDDRMLPGPAPTLIDPAKALSESTESTLKRTGLLDDQLSLALVHTPLTLHADPTRDTIVYVARGTGELDGLPLKPGIVAVLSGGAPVELTTSSDDGLAAWVFAPPRREP